MDSLTSLPLTSIYTRVRTLHDHALDTVTSHEYLGDYLTLNTLWNYHANIITGEASRALGYIKRDLKSAPPSLRKLPYQSYVCPKLEHASTICSLSELDEPHWSRSKQRYPSHCLHTRDISVTSLIPFTCLAPLATCRRISGLPLLHRLYFHHPLKRTCMPTQYAFPGQEILPFIAARVAAYL